MEETKKLPHLATLYPQYFTGFTESVRLSRYASKTSAFFQLSSTRGLLAIVRRGRRGRGRGRGRRRRPAGADISNA